MRQVRPWGRWYNQWQDGKFTMVKLQFTNRKPSEKDQLSHCLECGQPWTLSSALQSLVGDSFHTQSPPYPRLLKSEAGSKTYAFQPHCRRYSFQSSTECSRIAWKSQVLMFKLGKCVKQRARPHSRTSQVTTVMVAAPICQTIPLLL